MAAVNMPNQLPNRIFLEDKPCIIPLQQPLVQPWVPDERDTFISWLRSEFAAANAIIDAMCQHLQAIGSPGEYEFVLNCVRQRRYNWTAVLHMQQYFSVEEVVMALQQVVLKKRQMHVSGGSMRSAEGNMWNDSAFHRERRGVAADSKKDASSHTGKSDVDTGLSQQDLSSSLASMNGEETNHEWPQSSPIGSQGSSHDVKSLSTEEEDVQTPMVKVSNNFQSCENVDGRVINVVEGLKIYENVFNALESDHLSSFLSGLQGVGRKAEISPRGHRVVGGKRFLKGKGNELMQHNVDSTEDAQRSASPDETPESLPVTLQVIVDRLLECHILPASKRPDSYIINFLGEGGYLPPQIHNQDFEQPFCILTLQSECSIMFGRFISMNSPGDFRSPFKLSLSIGSVLVLQGNSAKVARYAIPALSTKRCCLTLGKMVSKRSSRNIGGFQRSAQHNSPTSGLVNPGFTSAVQTLSPGIPSSQVLPNASAPLQHGFPASAPQGGPYPPMTVMVPGWSPAPRPARLVSGTGVFLPYNASSGPGRPMNPGHRRQGAPLLQKTNSLPASFRTQNGLPSPVASAKTVEDSGASNSDIGTSQSFVADQGTSKSNST